ncbi:MAG: glycosyltransferase family 4 protein [Roseomonas sp.]|nr:glycosyltransferase family 4 protein [Roseomonas sp.]
MHKPRIYIDGFNLSLEQGTGVATYARNLSFALREIGAEVGVLYGTSAPTTSSNSMMREIAFFDPRISEPSQISQILKIFRHMLTLPFGEIAHEVPITGRVIRDNFRSRLPYFDHIWNVQDLFKKESLHKVLFGGRMNVRFREPPDIMHWTYPMAIHVPKAKNIYTLHDLVPLRLPYTTLDNKRHYFRLIQRLTEKADHLVTVSESSKRDIMSLFGVPEERITNTYQAVDIPAVYRNKAISDVKSDLEGTFGLSYKNYFLFFGAIEPKKNVGRLIEAYLASGVTDPLVIVGKKAWKSNTELQLISEGEHVRFLLSQKNVQERRSCVLHFEYATHSMLISLIRGAKAVLFPSLYEGFGLPALEAMSLGTPVLTSNTASLPEVVGNAALQIDPYDIRALIEGIRALNNDADLLGRLAEAGPIRAQEFSPERYQARLLKLYSKHQNNVMSRSQ